ncbi:tRNA pseudouridine(55) synthase TruB [Candidatus Peregrinibacteria bacterium]|jgi:tRNA pseudouridine55 synthase|nr:tRNA pseudouridine(55) synthase TruB [Candidatus Peregrinibacteria bacterium]MBT3599032.1 tRNA pseudouridine(55) synthase TruB [Candidatus Peregrinibacteria bacterium]MBT4367380.1 tRNA pseudouridine(55) synthase TruB [Candidatus Peregrinibacteria bacterium]MBT4586262.1 tRNA pseudouridine(55) synthase TruB [Candidatus Peregrinibacteria bacterium]MBT6730662.1 tRNA pseudouridine(55) synthase TruB [Candidatus Peregrinibacteria bacterium]
MRHGFLLVDKGVGKTSHDIVYLVRKALSEKKVGHLGTLDPAATGLLVLAVGAKALKVIEFFNGLTKDYEAEITLGSVSTTYDREGVIEEIPSKPGWSIPSIHTVQLLIQERFIGKIKQTPPAHSAVHVNGKRAYAEARKGNKVEMPEREVVIDDCRVVSYEYPKLVLHVSCSSGTYIRSIAHDMGHLLHCGGYLSGLRRTRVGDYSIDDSKDVSNIAWGNVIPLKEVLKDFARIDLTDEEFEDISHGRSITKDVKDGTFAWHKDLPVAVLMPLKDGSRQVRARKVL